MKRYVIIVCSLLVVGVFFTLFLKNDSDKIYKYIEVNSNKIEWGMNEEQFLSIMGQPESTKKTDSGDAIILHYSSPLETVLGKSQGADFHINTVVCKNLNNEDCNLGFIQIDLFFEETDEDTITALIEKNYGAIEGGSNYLDDVLKKIDTDFFSSIYYLQTGLIEELPKKTQENMLRTLEINNPDGSKKLLGSLVNFSLYGNKENVKVSINAKNLLVKNLAEGKEGR